MRKLTTLLAVSMSAALTLSAGMAVMADEPDFTGEGSIAYVCTGLGDMSFNDSGEVGMNTLRAAGYDVKTVETGDDASKFLDKFLSSFLSYTRATWNIIRSVTHQA